MSRAFDKPALTYEDQVALLQSRGMIIDDPAQAAFFLRHLNYYRLCAYWLPFEVDHASHSFQLGTRFSDVLDLYVFDRELRLLVLDAIERIEVSVRGQWAYQLAHRHGPHAHLDESLARHRDKWVSDLERLTREVHRADETFVRHLVTQYDERLPPVWAVCEVMSLGLLSRWYGNLGPKPTRRAISDVYSVNESVFQSWLHHVAHVRNICAHHSRLWNREFTITPQLPSHQPRGLATQLVSGSRKIYNTLVILLYLMDVVSPQHNWRYRLREHVGRLPLAPAAMDFPAAWTELPIWRADRP